VENAIEHAAAHREQPTTIVLRARRDEQRLHITVEDNGPGPGDGTPAREGVGLRNTRERLRKLYGEAATLGLRGGGPAPDAGARAEVSIPFFPLPLSRRGTTKASPLAVVSASHRPARYVDLSDP
jgi:LytS/YehU family sensor histidine kinase